MLKNVNNAGSKILFNPVFINPKQVVRVLLCNYCIILQNNVTILTLANKKTRIGKPLEDISPPTKTPSLFYYL